MPNGLLGQPGTTPPPMPMPGQPVPGQPVPGQPMPSQPMPGQPMPGQPMPSQPMPGQPMPSQPMPGQPVPGQPRQQKRNYNENPLGEADQDALEMFAVSAQKLIHSPQTRDVILNRIGISEQGPIDDISDTVLVIVDRIDKQAVQEQGQPVDDAVKLQGANIVTGQIIEVAEAAGKIPKMNDDEKAVTYSYAVQKYTDRMIQRGEITKQELSQHAQTATQTAQEAGQLDVNKVQQVGQGIAQDTAAANVRAADVAVAPDNPMRPTETMSQKLAKEGLLDG